MTKPNAAPEITPEQIDEYRNREVNRMIDGTYTPLPDAWRQSDWFAYGISNANMADLLSRLYHDDPQVRILPDFCDAYVNHYAHVSMSDGAMVAFTENHIKGVADRQTVMKAGKYLKKYYGHCLDDNTIRDMATEFSAEYAPMALQFATTADEIEEVYTNGPSSCMSYAACDYQGSCHPVRAYASPDLAVAYIARANSESEGVTARCVVWPERKVYTRIYGDATRIKPLLTEAGYKEGSLEGARLVAIHDRNSGGFVVPYVDYCNSAYDSQDGFLVIGRGHIHLHNTCGVSAEGTPCAHCGEHMGEEESYYCEGLVGDFCESCYSELTVTCERSDTTVLRDDAVQMQDGTWWSRRSFDRHGFMCPILEERFANDDGVEMADGEMWSQEAFDGSGFTSSADGRNYNRAELVVMADGALWHEDHFAEHGHVAADGSNVRNGDAPIDAVKYRCPDTWEMDFPFVAQPAPAGDLVRCIHHIGVPGQFTPGAEYQVSQRFTEYGRERIDVVEDDAGNPNGWEASYFCPSDIAVDVREAA